MDNLAGHEITYIDENDGTHIGENEDDGIELITSEDCEPPAKTQRLDAPSQAAAANTVSAQRCHQWAGVGHDG